MIVKCSKLRLDLLNFEHPIYGILYIMRLHTATSNIFDIKYTTFSLSLSQYNVDCVSSHNQFAFFIRSSGVNFIDFRAPYERTVR